MLSKNQPKLPKLPSSTTQPELSEVSPHSAQILNQISESRDLIGNAMSEDQKHIFS